VRGDRERLRQVIGNLIDNAIRFSPRGDSVEVVVSRGKGEAAVRVADRGPGVPAADHERIFERFERRDSARSRNGGGAGLGLAICREIVQAHGGRVWVQDGDGDGTGSVFVVALPA
jgi:signal transduction histidine kinase